MTGKEVIIDWLRSKDLKKAENIAIDDGGLTLIALDKNNEEISYLEIGGTPDPDDDEEDDED